MKEEDLKKRLFKLLTSTNSLPFLFIGSGFSKRYLNIESWKDLLSKFAIEAECKNINQYISNIDDGLNNLEKVASILAVDFAEKWWSLDKYKDSKNDFSSEIITNSSSLKLEICKYLKDIDIDSKIKELDEELICELEIFKQIKIDGVFTTNYDLLLEYLFNDYVTFINQKNILNSRNFNINEIYKIHGCCSDFNNIVLTEDDYKKFKKDNQYVMAKLLTIFVEHPVIFLGYSLTDKYIREIITSIADIVGTANLEKLKDKFIFISRTKDKIDINTRDIQIEDKFLRITNIEVLSYKSIFEVLASLKRKVPSKLLRYMKEEIYEFSQNSDSKEQFGVIDISDISDDKYKDIEFVIGIGIKKKFSELGYKSFENKDIFEHILLDDEDADLSANDYKKLMEITIPELKRKNPATNLPFNKFLFKASLTIEELNISDEDKNIFLEFNKKDLSDSTLSSGNSESLKKSLKEIIEDSSINIVRKLSIITSLPIDKIDVELLYKYLLEIKEECLYNIKSANKSKFYKAVCLYDRIKFCKE